VLDGDGGVGRVVVQQIGPVVRGVLPALHEAFGQLVRRESGRAGLIGDVLEHQAVRVAFLLGALGGFAAVGLVAVAVGACKVLREAARGLDQVAVGRDRAGTVGAPEFIGLGGDQPRHLGQVRHAAVQRLGTSQRRR
jgi:hypothetical protein